MNVSFRLVLATIWLTFGGTIVADDAVQAGPSMLIEPGQLQKKLKQENLRIVDVRSEDEYDQGHIPGAVRVDLGDWKTLALSDRGLHDSEAWAQRIGSLGIESDTHVVVYGNNVANAARIWWLLEYAGVGNVSLINGGWQAWTKKDRPVETTAPTIKPSSFTPKFQADRMVETDSVKKLLTAKDVKLVDTRSDGEFARGRVPHSVHLEWKHLLTEDGRFKSPQRLKALFQQRGILPAETAVCYCQTGGRATVDAFALELIGYPKVKVYVGGWSQWGNDPQAPKER